MEKCPGTREDINFELSVGKRDDEIERLCNKRRKNTLSFKFPTNGRIIIALLKDCFSKFVCSWMGSVIDWYLLHASKIGDRFELFKGVDQFSVIYDYDDENEGTLEWNEPLDTQIGKDGTN